MQYYTSPFNKEEEYKFPKDITIYDTTLRDGEQTPGVCFSLDDKLEIARKLDQLRIHQIEAGFPIVSDRESAAVKAIANEGLDAEIICLARTKKGDIDRALDCDVDGIITFMGTSDIHLEHKMHIKRQEALNICMKSIEYAKDHGLFVAFSAEDATRTDLDFLKRVYSKAESYGADRVTDVQIAMHCHNDFGLAVINSIYGLLAGGSAVSTTVNGIGERAGNASLEELIMSLKLLYGKDLGFKTKYIQELSELVSKKTGLEIPYNKPIVGRNVFRHESGIHVDAVIEEPLTYEPYLPELVGQRRQLVLGKHSGCRAVKAKLDECGFKVTNDQLCQIVKKVKESREEGKYIDDDVFKDIVRSIDSNYVDL